MNLLLPNNFSILRCNRSSKGGGVAILYNDNLKASVVQLNHSFGTNSKIECLCVKFQLNYNRSFLVCSLYRPKFNLTVEDIDEMELLIEEQQKKNTWWCVCGDLNIHFEQSNALITKFRKMLSRTNATLITTGPTRGEAELDVFITMNDTNISNSVVLDPKLSDHKMNVIKMKFTKKEPSPTPKTFKRNYSNINYSALGEAVTESTFIDEDAHVDDQVRAFKQHHLNNFNSMAPCLSIAKKNHKLGLTKSTLDLIKKT